MPSHRRRARTTDTTPTGYRPARCRLRTATRQQPAAYPRRPAPARTTLVHAAPIPRGHAHRHTRRAGHPGSQHAPYLSIHWPEPDHHRPATKGTSHDPQPACQPPPRPVARRRHTALAMATLPTFTASASPATTVLSGGPTVHEQQALSQAIPIAVDNVHTTITTTPGPAAHNYLVNLSIGVGNLAPAPRCSADSARPAPPTPAPATKARSTTSAPPPPPAATASPPAPSP